VYAEVAREFGLHRDAAEITAQFMEGWRARKNFGYSRAEWRDLVQQCFPDNPTIAAEMFDVIYERFAEPGSWLIYEDVIPTLQALTAMEMKLMVISNWDERLFRTLQGLGLASYFDSIIVSSEVGAHKPDVRLFQHAAEQIKMEPIEILHVGDSDTEDVSGAICAGFQARRVRRSGAEKDYDIDLLTGLLEQIPHKES
jgi:putative hydrolase of the HAD superfamily